jgi:serine/threonine-protein kinase HipA
MNVFTNKEQAGHIFRKRTDIYFQYMGNSEPEHAIAITMPQAKNAEYPAPQTGQLHPIFAMNLPEGEMREHIKKFTAKAIQTLDDLTLLEITGRSQTGRLRYAKSREELENTPGLHLDTLLKFKGTNQLFAGLLARFIRHSGISGAQPKIMVKNMDSPNQGKTTGMGTTHIVKFFNSQKLPALAANEYLCMKAAKNAGIPTPENHLANDGGCLVVKRFDLKDNNTYQAHEDCCTLAGLQPDDKYRGSYENIVKTLRTFQTIEKSQDMRNLFKLIIISMIIRNGDAHRKNFGIIYDTPDNVRLAPAYDLISTMPYKPADHLGLTLCGSTKWPSRKKLVMLGADHCHLPPQEVEDTINQTADAVADTREKTWKLMEKQTTKQDATTLKNMLAAWEDGLLATCERKIHLLVPRQKPQKPQPKKLNLETNFEALSPPEPQEQNMER